MKTRNRSTKLFAMVIAMVAAAAIWSAWGAGRAGASAPPEGDRQAFGLVGITFGQTAQLNVVNPVLVAPPEGDTPIQVEMTIFDGEGNILARSTQQLGPGQSASLSVDRDMLPRAGNRVQLGALVKAQSPPEGDHPRNRRRTRGLVVSTLEVIENATSKTSFVLVAPPEPD